MGGCVSMGGRRRVIADIQDRVVSVAILAHLEPGAAHRGDADRTGAGSNVRVQQVGAGTRLGAARRAGGTAGAGGGVWNGCAKRGAGTRGGGDDAARRCLPGAYLWVVWGGRSGLNGLFSPGGIRDRPE